MSDPLSERLSRFTPDGAGLDRDALLFDAGRLSARPNRRWQTLAVLLAAVQVLTVVLLWPKPVPPMHPEPAPAAAPVGPASPSGSDPGLLLLTRQMLEGQEVSLSPAVSDLVPQEPPLQAFRVPQSLLD